MKRFLIATALTASMSTAAFAITEGQELQIESYLPGFDAAALNDTQTATAMSIINGSDSRSTKMGKLKAIVAGIDYTATPAMATEAQMAVLKDIVPEVDLMSLSQPQLDAALALLNSGSDSTERAKVRALLINDTTPMGTTNSATEAEMVMLKRYIPEVDVASLTEAQLTTALAIVYSNDSASDIQSKLRALVN